MQVMEAMAERHTVPTSATQPINLPRQVELRGKLKWPKVKEREEWYKLDQYLRQSAKLYMMPSTTKDPL